MPDYPDLFLRLLAAVRHLRTAVRRWERAKGTGTATSAHSERKLKSARIELDAAIARVKEAADKL